MKRNNKYPTTATYQFTNRNPKGIVTTGDCVYRAISLALDKDWCEVVVELAQLSCETGLAPNSTKNFDIYLQRNGWKKMPMPKHDNGKKLTSKEFCQAHKTGTFVVNIANHTFCVKNGKARDTWDVTKYSKRVGNYWKEA